ncbi:MAG: hypothetical protein V4631_20290 [Pseudomonadota bacterium]
MLLTVTPVAPTKALVARWASQGKRMAMLTVCSRAPRYGLEGNDE